MLACPFCKSLNLKIDEPSPSHEMSLYTEHDVGNDLSFFEGPIVMIQCAESENHTFFLDKEIAQKALQDHYDPNFGDEMMCQCGHPYYRHFDTYDDMSPVGCKYCSPFTPDGEDAWHGGYCSYFKLVEHD